MIVGNLKQFQDFRRLARSFVTNALKIGKIGLGGNLNQKVKSAKFFGKTEKR
jgi:hypothetical protein